AGLVEEPYRLLVIGGRELEVDGAGGAPLQELDLDLADSAADLEDGRALDPPLLEKRNHPPRRLVEPLLSIALRGSPGEAWREEPVTAARIAAARHAESVSPAHTAAASRCRSASFSHLRARLTGSFSRSSPDVHRLDAR